MASDYFDKIKRKKIPSDTDGLTTVRLNFDNFEQPVMNH